MSIFETLARKVSVSASDFFSSRFFFLVAARACNLDILGGSDEPPSKPPPRTDGGLMKTVLRASGTFNQGISAKKLAQEDLNLVVVAHALQGSASEAPVGQGKSIERGHQDSPYHRMRVAWSSDPWFWPVASVQDR